MPKLPDCVDGKLLLLCDRPGLSFYELKEVTMFLVILTDVAL